MKININKKILIDALSLVSNISIKTTSEKIISNILIEAIIDDKDNYLKIKATNYDIEFAGIFKAEILKPGHICLNTAKLFNIIREFVNDIIQLETTPQNWVIITCSNSKIKLPGVDTESFPLIEFKPIDNKLEIDRNIFISAIDKTYSFIGENESKMNLSGLNLEINSAHDITWIGADSYRISRFISRFENPIEAAGNIIIPKKSLLEIKKILDFTDDNIVISFSKNVFQVFTKEIQFKTRLIEADFPKLDTLVTETGNLVAEVSKIELLNSVRILARVVDDNPNAVMKMTFKKGELLLESQKREFGEGNDDMHCDYSGEEISLGINIKFVLDAIRAFELIPGENIKIFIKESLKPIILQNEDNEDFRTVIMPVKIKW